MRTIFKYPLKLIDVQELQTHESTQVMSVQMQEGVICLWAAVDPTLPKCKMFISIVGTGNAAPQTEQWNYVGTVQQEGFVWHVHVAKPITSLGSVT